MDKTFISNQIKKINHDLDVVFNNSIISSSISSDSILKKAIEDNFNILFSFNSSKTASFKKLLTKYNTSFNKDFIPKSIDIIGDENDIIDQINWLSVYCTNTFNIDINTNTTISNSSEQITNTPSNQENTQNKISSVLGGETNPGAILALNQKITEAALRFNDDINSGKIFIYTSKPKIIPIIKSIFTYSFACFSFFLFLTTIMSFVGGSLFPNIEDFKWQNNIFSFALSVFYIVISSLNIKAQFTKKIAENDNFRYSFKWQNSSLTVGFSIIVTLLIVFSSFTGDNFFSILSNKVYPTSHAFAIIDLIFYILVFISLLLMLIFLIIGGIKSPKRDDKKIEELYKEYIKNLK